MSLRIGSLAGRAVGITLILFSILLPISGCSDDDDGPTGPELPEGIHYSEATGHYYEAVAGSMTWSAARDAAAAATFEDRAGQLACIDSEEENLFVYNELGQDVQRFFLGGFQDTDSPDYEEPDGGWSWCSGEDFTYDAWSIDEPNNGGGENFLAFIWGDAPVWNDVPGNWNVAAGYIIEYE